MSVVNEAEKLYVVVVNDEQQHSVWPVNKPVPIGWLQVGGHRSYQECLDYIDQNWQDIRPLSLRRAHDADAG